MYGPKSMQAELMKLKIACITDAKGNAKCKNLDASAGKGKTKGNRNMALLHPGPVPKHKRLRHSGSCNDPGDCDIDNDYLCASDKSIPLSSSWGQHTCTYVAGAAVAMVAVAMKPASVCRGRCLLDEDGTIEIPASANVLNMTALFDPSLMNVTEPDSRKLTDPSLEGLTDPASTNLTDALNAPLPDNPPDVVSVQAPLATGTASLPLNNSLILPSKISTPNITFQDLSSPKLNCPCNCTYVSTACCLSRIVWEDASQQIPMDPLPTNATMSCDFNSGKWVPKTGSGTTSSNSGVGFIGMHAGAVAANYTVDNEPGA